MFAFAIYDVRKKYLLLARDRTGQKPLVYFHLTSVSESGAVFVFASELQSLRRHPLMPKTLDPQALHNYFSMQYIPFPQTVYKDVRKLPPGHILEISEDDPAVRLSRYWSCNYSRRCKLKFEDAAEKLRGLMEDAVHKRLMSDVPLGAFLSGGIDSTITVAMMKKYSLMPVKTFTIGFEEEKYDERNFAVTAAGALDTEHYHKVVNPADFAVLEKLVSHYGEPYSDASMLPTYLLSQFTREKVTVALSGDGADELFAGYYRYVVMKYAKFADFIPCGIRRSIFSGLARMLPPKTEERTFTGRLRRICEVLSSRSGRRYFDMISRFSEDMKFSIYSDGFAESALHDTQTYFDAVSQILTAESGVEKIMETDLYSYLPGDILTKVDIASMANSLEVRSPFMDHRVVEFAASLPVDYKLRGADRKHILKEAFHDVIPKELLSRPKMGFGVPVARWLRKEWKNIAEERILDGRLMERGFFRRDKVEQMLSDHCSMKADNSYSLWALLIFELWLNSAGL
jgi:asparagine synthase (glutamine-hydrolysing)